MVWGGELEEIKFKEGDKAASVLFADARRCARYHEDTANGIEYKNKAIFVKLHDTVEPLIGTRKEMINVGVTRCVGATSVPDAILPGALNKLGKDTGALEHLIIRGAGAGRREVIWRFCNLEASSNFNSMLSRDNRFISMLNKFYFAPDPCATATGVHD